MSQSEDRDDAHLEQDNTTEEQAVTPENPAQTDNGHLTDEPLQRTLAIIKPDAIQAGKKDDIVSKVMENGFAILAKRDVQLSLEQARLFYIEHESKSFYCDLTSWMSSNPVFAMVLEKKNAVQEWRTMMGPTDSNKARDTNPDSIRALYGTDGSQNAIHGSDSEESASREIGIIFEETETSYAKEGNTLDGVKEENTETKSKSVELGDIIEDINVTENEDNGYSISGVIEPSQEKTDDNNEEASLQEELEQDTLALTESQKEDSERDTKPTTDEETTESGVESIEPADQTCEENVEVQQHDIPKDDSVPETIKADDTKDKVPIKVVEAAVAANKTGAAKSIARKVGAKATSSGPISKKQTAPKAASSETSRRTQKPGVPVSATPTKKAPASQMPRAATRVNEKPKEIPEGVKKTASTTATRSFVSRLSTPATTSTKRLTGTSKETSTAAKATSSSSAAGQTARTPKKELVPVVRTGLKKTVSTPSTTATATVTGSRARASATTTKAAKSVTETTAKTTTKTTKTSVSTIDPTKTNAGTATKRVLKSTVSGTRKPSITSAVKKQPETKREPSQVKSANTPEKTQAPEREEQPIIEQDEEVVKIMVEDLDTSVGDAADAEVAAVTNLRIKDASHQTEVLGGLASCGSPSSVAVSTSRPQTPEVAQLRNKFEALGSNQPSRSNSSTIHIQSKTPNHVKDLINRFAG